MSPAIPFFAVLFFDFRAIKEKETASTRMMTIHEGISGIEGDGAAVGVGVESNVNAGVWRGFAVVMGVVEGFEVGVDTAVEVGFGVGIGVVVGVGVEGVVAEGVEAVVGVGVGAGVVTVTVITLDVAGFDVASPGQTTLNWYVPASVKAISRLYKPFVIGSNVCL
jgi:hypothetical protein